MSDRDNWPGLKPLSFLRGFAARLKACPSGLDTSMVGCPRARPSGFVIGLITCLLMSGVALAQGKRVAGWRMATPAELQAVLPDRAQVEKERIETEMRSATGIIDGKGKMIAAVVLITAGYSANGKYSHYLVVQSPMKVGDVGLGVGNYVIGWTRGADGLVVHFYVAETGVEKGVVLAKVPEKALPVVPLKIWPPEKGVIQIGRFVMGYSVE